MYKNYFHEWRKVFRCVRVSRWLTEKRRQKDAVRVLRYWKEQARKLQSFR